MSNLVPYVAPGRRRWDHLRRIRSGRARGPLKRSGRLSAPPGGHPRSGGHPRRARILRGVAALFIIFIALTIARRYVIQTLDIERQVRQVLIPQIERQYGVKVEVGTVYSNWFSQVRLNDIVVDRTTSNPLGALLQVKSVTVKLDLVGLAMRHLPPVRAVEQIVVESPQIYVQRDKAGQLNLIKILNRQPPGKPGPRFAGDIIVRRGRVWLDDLGVRSASGRYLRVDAQGGAGEIHCHGDDPATFDLSLKKALIGPDQASIENVQLQGEAAVKGNWLAAGIRLPSAPLPVLADYGFPKREVVFTSGTVGAVAQVVYDKSLPKLDQWTAAGDTNLHDVSGYAMALREPDTGAPLRISNLNGSVTFNSKAATLNNLTLTALNTPMRVTGTAALLKEPVADITLQSNAFDTARLWRMAQFYTRNNKQLRTLAFAAGRASGTLHATGNPKAATIAADLSLPSLTARHPQFGYASMGPVHAIINADGGLSNLRADVRIQARGLEARHAKLGQAVAGTMTASLQMAGLPQTAQLAADIRLGDYAVREPHYGRIVGSTAHVTASSNDALRAPWNGAVDFTGVDARGIDLAAVAPAVAHEVRDIGNVRGSLRFAGLTPNTLPTVRGAVQMNHVTLRDYTFTDISSDVSFDGAHLRLANARTQSEVGQLFAAADADIHTKQVKLSFTAPRAQVMADRLNPFLKPQGLALRGVAVGRLSVTSSTSAPEAFVTRFDFTAPETVVRSLPRLNQGFSRLRAMGARVRGDGTIRLGSDNAFNFTGSAVLSADEVSATHTGPAVAALNIPSELSGARAVGMRVEVRGGVSANAAAMTPSATASINIDRVAVPIPGDESRTAVVQDITSTVLARDGSFQAPRIFARLVGGEITAHAELKDDKAINGEVLAERIDIAELQRLATAAGVKLPPGLAVRGRAFARAKFGGAPDNMQAKVEAHLYEAGVRYQGSNLPIEAARAEFSVQLPDLKKLPITDITIWTGGGRVQANGTVERQGADYALDLDVDMAGVRARDIALTPALANLQQQANLDGLIKGQLHIDGTATAPRVTGKTGLDVAQVYGLSVSNVTSDIDASMTPKGPMVTVKNLAGSADGTPFTGTLAVDFPAGTWSLKYACPGLPAQRLLTAASQVAATLRTTGASGMRPMTTAEEEQQIRELPLRGTFQANVDLSGTLPSADGTRPFAPQNGTIDVTSDVMRWRGLQLGRLTADLNVNEGTIEAKTLELRRSAKEDAGTAEASTPPGASGVAGASPAPVAPAPAPSPDDAVLSVTGNVQVAAGTPSIDAEITATNQHVAFYLDVAEEVRRTLAKMGRPLPVLETVTNVRRSLRGLDGRLDSTIEVLGEWPEPIIGVKDLTLRDNRAYGQFGELHVLPSVKTEFDVFKNKITIKRGEIRQAATNPDDEDTVLRIIPLGQITLGGDIALNAELLYANLSQMAPWVPALRDEFGQPVVSGQVSEFTFGVTGTTVKPLLVGSLQADDLRYRNYTLKSLRVSRFEINDDRLEIPPNQLTIVKGDFQSSSVAWGQIPWSWQIPGPARDRPIDIHMKLSEPKQFNALAAVLVPAITKVDAESVNAAVDVTGTLDKRLVQGILQFKNATFRANPAQVQADIGVQKMSGTVHFGYSDQEQRVEIDKDDLIRGELVQASRIDAPDTNNPTAAERNPRLKARATTKAPKPPNIAGTFVVRGGVHKDLQTTLETPADLRYDLRFALEHGAFSTDEFSGFQDINLGVQWKTANGPLEREAQIVSWMLSAVGRAAPKKQTPGRITSLGALRLDPNFMTGSTALLQSQARPFTQSEDFKDLAVYTQFTPAQLKDARSGVNIDRLFLNMRNVGSGVLDGNLTLDNQPAIPRIIPEAPAQPRQPLQARLATARFGRQIVPRTDRRGATPNPADSQNSESGEPPSPLREVAQRPGATGRTRTPGRRVQDQEFEEEPPDVEPSTNKSLPLRLAGQLTVSQVQFLGTPPASAGGAVVELPNAPVLDIQVALGQKVAFSTSNLNVELAGSLDVSGTPRDPLITGEVETRSGFIRFPNASARITSGKVNLLVRRSGANNEIMPRASIDATAEGQSGEYSISMHLSGPLDLGSPSTQDLKVSVTTNPPLSQDAALKQILGTANPDKNALLGVGIAPVFGSVEQTIAKAFGLDSLVVEYRLNEPLRVQAGKRIGDRIFVTYRHRVSGDTTNQVTNVNTGEEYSLRIDYRLRGNTKLGLHIDRTNNENRQRITIERSWQF